MFNSTQVGLPPRRFAITIPSNAGTGSTIADLLATAGYTGKSRGLKILGLVVAGTNRAAFVAATPRLATAIAAGDFTTHGQYVAAGADYYEPSENDADTYVRSADGSTVAACVIVYE